MIVVSALYHTIVCYIEVDSRVESNSRVWNDVWVLLVGVCLSFGHRSSFEESWVIGHLYDSLIDPEKASCIHPWRLSFTRRSDFFFSSRKLEKAWQASTISFFCRTILSDEQQVHRKSCLISLVAPHLVRRDLKRAPSAGNEEDLRPRAVVVGKNNLLRTFSPWRIFWRCSVPPWRIRTRNFEAIAEEIRKSLMMVRNRSKWSLPSWTTFWTARVLSPREWWHHMMTTIQYSTTPILSAYHSQHDPMIHLKKLALKLRSTSHSKWHMICIECRKTFFISFWHRLAAALLLVVDGSDPMIHFKKLALTLWSMSHSKWHMLCNSSSPSSWRRFAVALPHLFLLL